MMLALLSLSPSDVTITPLQSIVPPLFSLALLFLQGVLFAPEVYTPIEVQ